MDKENIKVYAAADCRAEAEALAVHLGLPLTGEPPEEGLALRLDTDGLALTGGGMELRGDLAEMLPRLRQDRLRSELLVRAAKLRGAAGPLTAVDATAGLGEDALLLAAAGFCVTLYECDPVIAALLRDSLRRAAGTEELAPIVARMTLIEGDSIVSMAAMTRPPDLIYLDPMFPERQKSGLIKKKFQLLQRLERPCADEETLLRTAIAARPRRVVVKRPAKGPNLAGIKPGYSIRGKAVRYDCIPVW